MSAVSFCKFMMAENEYFDVIEILDKNFESTEAMPKLPEKRKLAGVIKGKDLEAGVEASQKCPCCFGTLG